MLIKKDNIIINLDNVKEICLDGYNNNEIIFMYDDGTQKEMCLDGYNNNKIIFMYNDRTQKEIYVQDRNKVFNDIIANYNSGKKVYEIE